MLFHNFMKYRGYRWDISFFDAKDFISVGVFCTKAICIYFLHISFPNFLIFYVDADAVVFDQVFVDLQRNVKPPCIASATVYAGMHNAGWYCAWPEDFGVMSCEPEVADVEDFVSDVIIHDGRVKDKKVGPEFSSKCCLWYG